MRELKHGRQPAPALILHSTLTQRLADIAQQGVNLRSFVRAIKSVVCERTVFVILSGRGRATPTALCAVNILSEILGSVDRDQRVQGLILDAPNVMLTGHCLGQLAQEGPAARAFAVRRLAELEDLHSGFGLVELPATQEARS